MASAGPDGGGGGGRLWDIGVSRMAVVGTGAETAVVCAVAAGGLYAVVADAAGATVAAGAGEGEDAMTAEGGAGSGGVLDMVCM